MPFIVDFFERVNPGISEIKYNFDTGVRLLQLPCPPHRLKWMPGSDNEIDALSSHQTSTDWNQVHPPLLGIVIEKQITIQEVQEPLSHLRKNRIFENTVFQIVRIV